MHPLRHLLGPRSLACLGLAVATLVPALRARACDVCAIYTATEERESQPGFRIAVAEQFTRFATLKTDGEEIPNPGERLNSSITQLILGYDVNTRFGFQLTLPVIVRDFRRRENGVITSGDETGLGDMSLIGIVRPYSYMSDRVTVRTSLLGGLEFPTGSADRLREESHHAEEPHDEEDGGGIADHHEGHDHGGEGEEDLGPIGVHGHDLALGSGSFDGIIGGTLFASWDRFFWTTAVQYAMRTEGSFDYRYANDLTWSGGPAVFPWLEHDSSVAVSAIISGEHKGTDTVDGEEADDTGITAVYMGPEISVTLGSRFLFDIAADFPLVQDNTATQIVPDYRIRGALAWRF